MIAGLMAGNTSAGAGHGARRPVADSLGRKMINHSVVTLTAIPKT